MEPTLEMRSLVLFRDNRQVLDIESLFISTGEIMALLGPNGTGKSSLLLTLARLLKPASGELLWRGQPVNNIGLLDYRRKLALLLQEPLLLGMSVFDNVAIGLRYRGVAGSEINTRVTRWLKRLGIEKLSDRLASRLSGGEAQRVSLARAFVIDPELLLLDEPFSALDSPTRARLLSDLKAILAETGTTTIFITHDFKDVEQLANRAALMLDGKIVQSGTPQQVFANPVSDMAACFLKM